MSNPFLQHAQRLKTGFLEREHLIFVDGKWIEPSGRERNAVIDPSTGEALTTIAMGKAEDIDRAVAPGHHSAGCGRRGRNGGGLVGDFFQDRPVLRGLHTPFRP
jgi:hypothetical protein